MEHGDCNMISGHYDGICIMSTGDFSYVFTDVQTEMLPQTDDMFFTLILFFSLQTPWVLGSPPFILQTRPTATPFVTPGDYTFVLLCLLWWFLKWAGFICNPTVSFHTLKIYTVWISKHILLVLFYKLIHIDLSYWWVLLNWKADELKTKEMYIKWNRIGLAASHLCLCAVTTREAVTKTHI